MTTLAILTLSIYILQGFRFIIVIFVVAPIIYRYLKNKKRPRLFTVTMIILVIGTVIVVVGFARVSLKSGTAVDWSKLNLDFVIRILKVDFEIYKPFYGLVKNIPTMHSFTMGEQFLYTFITLIPRVTWPSKPLPKIHELIALSVNEVASKSGLAWPNIAEFYSEFGTVGSIVGMYIFGRLCGMSKELYQSKLSDDHSLIAYSIILPSLLQLVIRGYTPTNFYLLLFLLMPIVYIKHTAR